MRRRAAAVMVCAMALGACGDDDDTVPAQQSTSTRPEQVNELPGDDERPEPTEREEGDGE